MTLDLDKFFAEAKNVQQTLDNDCEVLREQLSNDKAETRDNIYEQLRNIQIVLAKLGDTQFKPCYKWNKELKSDKYSRSLWFNVQLDSNKTIYIYTSDGNDRCKYSVRVSAGCITEPGDEFDSKLSSLSITELNQIAALDLVAAAEHEIVEAVERFIREQCERNDQLTRR